MRRMLHSSTLQRRSCLAVSLVASPACVVLSGFLPTVLDRAEMAGIPLLVLGNKNDLPGALSAEELIEKLYVRTLFSLKGC